MWVGGLIDDLVSRYDELIGGQWYQGITAEWEEVVIVESLGVRNQAVVACSGNRVPIYSSTMIAWPIESSSIYHDQTIRELERLGPTYCLCLFAAARDGLTPLEMVVL